MKKIVMIAATAALMISVFMLTGCGVKADMTYDNADKYTAGDVEIADTIHEIDVDYIAGDIDIISGSSDKITVHETAEKDLDEDHMVHTWVDGKKLYIKYCASDNDLDFTGMEKHLTITVPDGTDLSEFKLDAAAGNITVKDIKTEELNIDAAAGDIALTLKDLPKETDIDAAAGNIKIQMPEAAGVTLKFDNAVGDFDCNIPYVKNEDNDEYVFGDGSHQISIDMAAGDLEIRKL